MRASEKLKECNKLARAIIEALFIPTKEEKEIINSIDDWITEETEREKPCQWKYREYNDYYETDCGRGFQLMADSPKENKYFYCPGCGKKIQETDW